MHEPGETRQSGTERNKAVIRRFVEEVQNIAATGNRVTVQYVDIMRVRGGRIVEHWPSMDQLSLLQQLGAIPS